MKNDFDFYDLLYSERIDSKKDVELSIAGYKFITNFTIEKEELFRKAAEIHNIKIQITDDVYIGNGLPMNDPCYRALYVSSSVENLSDFWSTVDELRNKSFT